MTTGLFTEIVIELKEKAAKIPPKIRESASKVSAFVKKFTTEPFNYAILQSIIFVILILRGAFLKKRVCLLYLSSKLFIFSFI